MYVLLNNYNILDDGYVIYDYDETDLFIVCVYIVINFETILSWYSLDCNQNRLLFPIKMKICGTCQKPQSNCIKIQILIED